MMEKIESILTSIKKNLGILEEYEHFDPDLIMHINSVFSILCQLGVGPKAGFQIEDKTAVWSDFLPDDDPRLNMTRSYMEKKVKVLFDDSLSTSVVNAINDKIKELEWRLNVQVDPGD